MLDGCRDTGKLVTKAEEHHFLHAPGGRVVLLVRNRACPVAETAIRRFHHDLDAYDLPGRNAARCVPVADCHDPSPNTCSPP